MRDSETDRSTADYSVGGTAAAPELAVASNIIYVNIEHIANTRLCAVTLWSTAILIDNDAALGMYFNRMS